MKAFKSFLIYLSFIGIIQEGIADESVSIVRKKEKIEITSLIDLYCKVIKYPSNQPYNPAYVALISLKSGAFNGTFFSYDTFSNHQIGFPYEPSDCSEVNYILETLKGDKSITIIKETFADIEIYHKENGDSDYELFESVVLTFPKGLKLSSFKMRKLRDLIIF